MTRGRSEGMRRGGAFLLGTLLVACAVEAPGSGPPGEAREQPETPRGAQLRVEKSALTPNAKFCSSAPTLKYYGGPVLQNVKVYSVDWGAHVNAIVTLQMPAFYQDLLASSYFDWLSEYATVGLDGQDGQPGSNQGIGRGTFAGSVAISPSLCAGTGSANSCSLTDAQVRTELDAQIAAGVLPAPTTGCDGDPDTLYMVNFPPSARVFLSSTMSTCVEICAYHGTGIYKGSDYAYGVIPDYFTGACSAGGCGPAQPLAATTNIASHELVEAVTDPEVGLAASPTSRPGAWHDVTCGEIGDICEHLYDTISPSGTTWTVQQMWSNAVNDCITTKASLPPVCTGVDSPAGCRPCACSDDNRAAPGVPGCNSPDACAGGVCVAPTADAGTDAGAPLPDAGADAGSPPDAGVETGSPVPDAGVESGPPAPDAATDSGSPSPDAGGDSGAVVDGGDASVSAEASAPPDTGGDTRTEDGSDASPSPAEGGGCGCHAVSQSTPPDSARIGLGALAAMSLVRRRWRRSRKARRGPGGEPPRPGRAG